jgi:hypothetical protein
MYSDNCTVNLSVNKMISEKITCMNGSIKKDTVETKTLRVPSFVKEDVNLKKQNSENGQSSNISNAPQDQCSKSHSNTEVLEAAASPNNDPASTQKASCIRPDTAAVNLPMKTEQIAPDNRREITSPAQADVSVLHNASFNQKLYEKQLQEHQLETDDALTDSRKDAPAALCTYGVGDGLLGRNGQSSEPHIGPCPAALPIHDGGQGLLGPNGQASEHQTDPIPAAFPVWNGTGVILEKYGQVSGPADPFCKPTPTISDTVSIAQIIPTEVTV